MNLPARMIDAHLHFQPSNPHFDAIAKVAGHENTATHVEDVFCQLGIVHGVVMGNREITNTKQTYPSCMSYCVGVHQHALLPETWTESIGAVEQHLRRPSCTGIKLYAGYCPKVLMDEAYQPFYELAEAADKPVAVHMGVTASSQALLKYCHPLLLDEVAVQYPRVQFVMCHYGNPWLMDAAAVLEKNDNVAADLSGLLAGNVDLADYCTRLSGYIEQVRQWVAYVEDYSKFLYGTDWPLPNMTTYANFISTLIPEAHWDDVFFQNANRIYHLNL